MAYTYDSTVGHIIHGQLVGSTPVPTLWSWGASKWQIVGENVIDVGQKYQGGLKFYVRGRHHTGHVLITLGWDDTYTVHVGHVRKGKMKCKDVVKDVYCDQLSEVVDHLVEYIPQYGER